MIRRQLFGLFCSVTLAASLAGCGSNSGNNNNNGGTDLATGGGGQDLAVGGPVDMAKLKQTGDPCTANTECAPSIAGSSKAPICIKVDATSKLTYKNGYCSSPCRPAQSEPGTGLNMDCPNPNATCELTSQTTGRCVALCQQASTDCRVDDGYVCLNNTPYAASCTPKGPNWCDPKQPMSCPKAQDGNSQLCTDFSPDQSAGECTEICDVFRQNCPVVEGTQVQQDCLASPSGSNPPTCIAPSGTGTLDAPCRYLNDCAAGFACHAKKGSNAGSCQPYCRVGTGVDAGVANADAGQVGDVACPANHQCVDLKKGTVGPTTLGICEPM